MNEVKSTKPKSPADFPKKAKAWWGPRAAVLGMVAFAVIALAPLAWVAARELAAGNPVTLKEVRKKAGEMEKKKEEALKGLEIKAAAELPGGIWLIGAKTGLLEGAAGDWRELKDYPGHEPKSLCAVGSVVWVADKEGLHRRSDGKWSTALKGDFHMVAAAEGGTVIAVRKKPEPGVLRVAADGKAELVSLELPRPPKVEKCDDHD